jgi:hypothetical protein
VWKSGNWNFLGEIYFVGEIYSLAAYASDNLIAVGGNFASIVEKQTEKNFSYFVILVSVLASYFPSTLLTFFFFFFFLLHRTKRQQ